MSFTAFHFKRQQAVKFKNWQFTGPLFEMVSKKKHIHRYLYPIRLSSTTMHWGVILTAFSGSLPMKEKSWSMRTTWGGRSFDSFSTRSCRMEAGAFFCAWRFLQHSDKLVTAQTLTAIKALQLTNVWFGKVQKTKCDEKKSYFQTNTEGHTWLLKTNHLALLSLWKIS